MLKDDKDNEALDNAKETLKDNGISEEELAEPELEKKELAKEIGS